MTSLVPFWVPYSVSGRGSLSFNSPENWACIGLYGKDKLVVLKKKVLIFRDVLGTVEFLHWCVGIYNEQNFYCFALFPGDSIYDS